MENQAAGRVECDRVNVLEKTLGMLPLGLLQRSPWGPAAFAPTASALGSRTERPLARIQWYLTGVRWWGCCRAVGGGAARTR